MPEAVIQCLAPAPGQCVVDATVGGGGHAELLLDRVLPGGHVIGIDRDPSALAAVRERLPTAVQNGALRLLAGRFSELTNLLAEQGVTAVDGILADLGVSSPQLDTPERGFSFQHEGPLDMRMNPEFGETAAELIHRLGEEDLADLIYAYGEERHSRRIARAIVAARRRQPLTSTRELAEVVARAMPGRGRMHPATRTFQALRIAVNGEMRELEGLLAAAPDCLRQGGRLAVISFHSLEDRLVKHQFQAWRKAEKFRILTPKPMIADRAETLRNPRSRSAKLRAAVKLPESQSAP